MIAATLRRLRGRRLPRRRVRGRRCCSCCSCWRLFGQAVARGHIDLDLRTRPPVPVRGRRRGAHPRARAWPSSLVTSSAFAAALRVGVLPAGRAARGRRHHPLRRPARCGPACSPAFLALCLLGAYWNVTYPRTQGRVAAHAINAAAAPGDLVVFCPDQLGPGVQPLAARRRRRRRLPDAGLARPGRLGRLRRAQPRRRSRPPSAPRCSRRAGDHQIFLVWQADYRTFEGQCEALFNALGAARPGQRRRSWSRTAARRTSSRRRSPCSRPRP